MENTRRIDANSAKRRSARLAAKPRVNYAEPELEEEEIKAVKAELAEAEKELISTPSHRVNSYMWALLRRAKLQDRLAKLEEAA